MLGIIRNLWISKTHSISWPYPFPLNPLNLQEAPTCFSGVAGGNYKRWCRLLNVSQKDSFLWLSHFTLRRMAKVSTRNPWALSSPSIFKRLLIHRTLGKDPKGLVVWFRIWNCPSFFGIPTKRYFLKFGSGSMHEDVYHSSITQRRR